MTTAHGDSRQFGGRGRSSAAASARQLVGVLLLGVRAQDASRRTPVARCSACRRAPPGTLAHVQLLEHGVARLGQVGQRRATSPTAPASVAAARSASASGRQGVGAHAGDEVDEHRPMGGGERAVVAAPRRSRGSTSSPGAVSSGSRVGGTASGGTPSARAAAPARPLGAASSRLLLDEPRGQRTAQRRRPGPGGRRHRGGAAAGRPARPVAAASRGARPWPATRPRAPATRRRSFASAGRPPARPSGDRRAPVAPAGRPAASGRSAARRTAVHAATDDEHAGRRRRGRTVGHDVGQRTGGRRRRVAPVRAEQRAP